MFINRNELLNNGGDGEQKKKCSQLLKILECSLKKSDPYFLIKKYFKKKRLNKYNNIYVVGAGKGTFRMAVALEEVFGNKITAGCINVPAVINGDKLKKIKVVIAGHPYPNEGSVIGTKKILELVEKAKSNDLIIGLFSGGASALMAMPIKGVSLKDQIKVTELLLKSGAAINDVNTIRKHLSEVKGGRLACKACNTEFLALYLSDVVGDDLSTIASGPTVIDKTTYQDAWNVFKKYSLLDKIPFKIIKIIEEGKNGERLDTPKKLMPNIHNVIIGSHKTLAQAAYVASKKMGFSVTIQSAEMKGDTEKYGSKLINLLHKKNSGSVIIAAGETTFKVRTKNPGGRNQQMGLVVIPKIKVDECFIAFDSDGVDGVGPEKVGGVLVDYNTYLKAKRENVNLRKILKENDAYNFFKRFGGLIKTGYVGTNLGDIVLLAK